MWLRKLQAHGLRCFSQCEITFSPGINILYGDNGAGKTSILEGISVLSCGKSFRTSRLSHIAQHNSNELTLYGEVASQDDVVKLGVKSTSGLRELRINLEKTSKWSELAKNLPVLDIHPESYLLVMGGPVERRKFLNWGMFHVEPQYASIWSEYTRALKQRNICLRFNQIGQAKYWHEVLSQTGETISRQLAEYTEKLTPLVTEIASRFNLDSSLEIKYSVGWDQDYTLLEHLERELLPNEFTNTTQYGPHRADLTIKYNNKLFSKTSSRGQQKILSIALKIAQAKLLKHECSKSCVYLIDELPAELDENMRQTALTLLQELDSQVIISAVARESVNIQKHDITWFHVEHGQVISMV